MGKELLSSKLKEPPLTPKEQRTWDRIHVSEAKTQYNLGMSREEMNVYFKAMATQKTRQTMVLESTPAEVPPTIDINNFNGWDQVAKQLFPNRKNVTGWFRG